MQNVKIKDTKYSRDSPRMRCGAIYWIEAALYSNCVSGKTLKVRAAPPPRAQTRGPTVAKGICWIEATLYKGHGSCAASRWPDRPTWHAARAMPQDINPEAAKLALRHASPELASSTPQKSSVSKLKLAAASRSSVSARLGVVRPSVQHYSQQAVTRHRVREIAPPVPLKV